jgi:hypothetical protein
MCAAKSALRRYTTIGSQSPLHLTLHAHAHAHVRDAAVQATRQHSCTALALQQAQWTPATYRCSWWSWWSAQGHLLHPCCSLLKAVAWGARHPRHAWRPRRSPHRPWWPHHAPTGGSVCHSHAAWLHTILPCDRYTGTLMKGLVRTKESSGQSSSKCKGSSRRTGCQTGTAHGAVQVTLPRELP